MKTTIVSLFIAFLLAGAAATGYPTLQAWI
jgi:hypothetical protein